MVQWSLGEVRDVHRKVREELLINHQPSGLNTELGVTERHRSWRGLSRMAGAMAAAGAVTALLGVGTASADPVVQPDAATGAAEQSTDALVHHIEKYHLEQPTWELTTDPKTNIEVHHHMLDEVTDPWVQALP